VGLRRSLKATNIINNSDFLSTAGWTASGGVGVVANNIYTLTGNGTNAWPNLLGGNNSNSYASGSKMYMRALANPPVGCTRLDLIWRDTTSTLDITAKSIANLTMGTFNLLTGIVTLTANSVYPRLQVVFTFPDAATTNGKVMQIQKVMAINLANTLQADILALSDANLKAWCDANITACFDGTLSGGRFGGIGGLK